MAQMFSEKAQAVLNYLQDNSKADIQAKELAEALGIESRSVTGVVNGLVRKGYVMREESEVDGKTVKFIRLTADGLTVDPEMEKPAKDAE